MPIVIDHLIFLPVAGSHDAGSPVSARNHVARMVLAPLRLIGGVSGRHGHKRHGQTRPNERFQMHLVFLWQFVGIEK